MRRLGALLVVAGCAGAPRGAAVREPDVRAQIRAAEDAERARRHDVARAHYEHAVAAASTPDGIGFACGRFGETLATWGEYGAARTQLERSVGAAPRDPAPWHDLGVVREHEGDSRGALDAFEHAVALASSDWRPRLALAALRWKLAARCFHATPGPCAAEVDAARAAYRAMLELDLPGRLRDKVRWALAQLDLPRAGLATSSTAPTPTP